MVGISRPLRYGTFSAVVGELGIPFDSILELNEAEVIRLRGNMSQVHVMRQRTEKRLPFAKKHGNHRDGQFVDQTRGEKP
jgi:hypothetical protein